MDSKSLGARWRAAGSREAPCTARRVLRALCWGALAVALSGCVKPLSLTGIAWPKAFSPRRTVDVERAVKPEKATLKTFALHALLEPMIDGDSPPRWVDPSESFDCEV